MGMSASGGAYRGRLHRSSDYSLCADNFTDCLEFWHEFRIPLLLLVGAFAVIAWLRSNREHGKPNIKTSTASKSEPAAPQGGQRDEPQQVKPVGPKRVVGKKKPALQSTEFFDPSRDSIQPLIFFSSIGGTTEAAANGLCGRLKDWIKDYPSASQPCLEPRVLNLYDIEYDEYFITPPKDAVHVKFFYLFLVPTYNIDTALNPFLEHLEETHNDFRIDTAPLSPLLGYSVFGFGDKEGWPTEEEGFCSQAVEVDKWMAKLTLRKRAFPLGVGDCRSDWRERLHEWTSGVTDIICELRQGNGLGEGVPGSGDAEESDVEGADGDSEQAQEPRNKSSALEDMEDLGSSYRGGSAPLIVDFTAYKSRDAPDKPLKEMVPKTSPTYAALTKQGYTIVGSHSGVKLCRWLKSSIRGRGSCYKFSFYGIKSHLCMEATPSLSCSNKCVFCWRHGTNPVGTVWRWQVDPPELIFEGVKAGHYQKIKMLKGVPGVRAERFAEAQRIRHCALSLVGEPIFYPHINAFLALLHAERISSFLVCNAQHPEQLAALDHVTQLYVSIDASNRDSLRRIDRPLHRDFWERFVRCLDILREQRFRQRTVFRLTLVKGFNIEDEAEGYAALVERGLPCFVEVKGVTYCGTSTSVGAGLTMQNVPFYEEVCEFVQALVKALGAARARVRHRGGARAQLLRAAGEHAVPQGRAVAHDHRLRQVL